MKPFLNWDGSFIYKMVLLLGSKSMYYVTSMMREFSHYSVHSTGNKYEIYQNQGTGDSPKLQFKVKVFLVVINIAIKSIQKIHWKILI